jgi:hypothetical protein
MDVTYVLEPNTEFCFVKQTHYQEVTNHDSNTNSGCDKNHFILLWTSQFTGLQLLFNMEYKTLAVFLAVLLTGPDSWAGH